MTFASVEFFRFVVGVAVLSLIVGRRFRTILLLLASCAYFATWKAPSLFVALAIVTTSSFFLGLAIDKQHSDERKTKLARLGIGVTLCILVVFRSHSFVVIGADSIANLLGFRHLPRNVSLYASVGISYYTLQAISYLVDIRDGVVAAERNFCRYALYITFFPKFVQGPMERAETFLPQLSTPSPPKFSDFTVGSRLILFGLFQKTVVADRLAPFVAKVYGDVQHFTGLPLLIATYFFAAQLYFDFAGYTDIARGVARLFAIQLTRNFNSPYSATSVADFWRRWHISFSSCLLDYVFRPLQLDFRNWRIWGTPLALLVTFVLSGLWHGSTWCFLAWGLLHGVYLAVHALWQNWRQQSEKKTAGASKWTQAGQVILTFHLVVFAWIFFRANTLRDAVCIVGHLISGFYLTVGSALRGYDLETLLYLNMGFRAFIGAICVLAFGMIVRACINAIEESKEQAKDHVSRRKWPLWIQTGIYALMFYLVIFVGSAAQGFVYEQF